MSLLARRLKLGTFFGIGLYVHWTFFLLPIAVLATRSGSSAPDLAFWLSSILVLISCIVLHEYGHALAARAFGIGTRDITMLPIGGVARLNSMPKEPWKEIVVALAGPAVNVVIAGAMAIALLQIEGALRFDESSELFLAQTVMILNVGLVLFNLIPAFPMDGGRVFRAISAMFTTYVRATWVAMRVGQVLAITLGFYGFFYLNIPFSPLIAAIIFFVGTMEYRQVEITAKAANVKVRDVMIRNFRCIDSDATIGQAAELISEYGQETIPVISAGCYRGVVSLSSVTRADDCFAPVESAVEWEAAVHENDSLSELLVSSPTSSRRVIPVLGEGDALVGMLDLNSSIKRIELLRVSGGSRA